VLARTVLDTTSEGKAHMSNFTTIENTNLATINGGGEYTNDYSDLSNLNPHDPEARGLTPAEHLDRFLYGGNMTDGDRDALVRNWEESNGRKAPTNMRKPFQMNLNGQWPQTVA
jgi:hypothetical protein